MNSHFYQESTDMFFFFLKETFPQGERQNFIVGVQLSSCALIHKMYLFLEVYSVGNNKGQ